MTQTIQSNGVIARRDPLTGSWKIDRDPVRNIPQITLAGTNETEILRALTILASAPTNVRTAMTYYYNTNQNITINLTMNPMSASGLAHYERSAGLYSPVKSYAAGNTANTITLDLQRRDYWESGQADSTIYRYLDNKFVENFVHEFLHPFYGDHRWMMYDPVTQTYYQTINDTTVGSDPTLLRTFEDLSQLGITPIQTNGTLASYLAQKKSNIPPLRDTGAVLNKLLLPKVVYTREDSGRYQTASSLGAAVGSTIGRFLVNNNVVAQTIAGSVFATIGQNLGQFLSTNGLSGKIVNVREQTVSVLDDFGAELGTNLKNAAIGAISSALFMELGRALGVKGFGAELLNNTGSTILGKVLDNLVSAPGGNLFAGLNKAGLFGKVESGIAKGGLLPSAIGSFLGSKLGSLILAPINTEGAILSSIGATAGVIALTTGAATLGLGSVASALTQFFSGIANIGVPFVGSLVGFLLGSLIGRLFGRKKPRIPTASAETFLDLSSGRWSEGGVSSANGGNVALAQSMAQSAVDGINNLIDYVVGGTDINGNANSLALREKFGHSGNTIYFDWFNGSGWTRIYSGSDGSVATETGISYALRETRIRGGDIFAKRALYRMPNASLASMLGYFQIATDYRQYLTNAPSINAAIAADPSSTFAAGWIVTLLQAEELGLSKFAPSDFYGGLMGFAESFGFGRGDRTGVLGQAFETLAVTIEGNALRVSTLDGSAPFDLLSGSNNWPSLIAGQSVLVPDYASVSGFVPWSGQATAGNDLWVANTSGGPVTMDDTGTQWIGYWDPYFGYYQYPVTVTGGDDIFIGSAYDDALYGRAGWDWLDGGGGNDLIDGGENDDVLLGRDGRDRLVGGSGADYIAGGDGDDYFFDQNQTWGLYGGDGNDVLVGGGGMDSSYGENGDDLFVIDQDGGGTWDALNGQAGSDTISYERFTQGVYIDFATLGGWSWDPSAKYIYGDSIAGMENVTGTRWNDIILGDTGGNVLRGLAGDDALYGRDGDDTLEGGVGADHLDGGAGSDTASYSSSNAGVYIDLGSGMAAAADAAGDVFTSIENITGSKFDDELRGDGGNNVLNGGGGDDFITMSGGSDVIDGGSGRDTFDASTSTSPVTIYYDSGYTYEYDPWTGEYVPVYTGPAGTYASSGYGTSILSGIEHYIGTDGADYISGGAADETFEGRAGNDNLAGGGGSDTYVMRQGGGTDSVSDDASGTNTIRFGSGINWRDVAIYGANYQQQGGSLTVAIRGTSDQFVVGGNFSYVNSGANAGQHNHVIKAIDLFGVSTIDIETIDWTPYAADDNSTVVYGAQNRSDLIFAYAGDDTIYVAGNSTAYETRGNVVYAGDGNDAIYGSYGDDQYIFERGNGADVLTDNGGVDTIVMGPSVSADDVIYEVVVTSPGASADLYVGLRDPNNPSLTASQVADRIQIVGGGTKHVGISYGNVIINTAEHVRVGGQEIDLTKADINWETTYFYDGGYFPVALDLDGDGIELRSVHGSRIASVEADGTISRVGWLGQDDGFLALDRNGDGTIDRIGEISFIGDVEGAKSDLEGLAAYDSNGDGKLDASDKRFGEFRVWQDRNQDGYGSSDELMSLEEAGLRSIGLKGKATGFTPSDGFDNVVLATSEIEWADPLRTGAAHDVMLARLQLRTDDADTKARGGSDDPVDRLLYGVQGLTEAQVAVIREVKAAARKDGDAGLLHRIETLLESGATSKSGLYTIDTDTAASLSAAAGRRGLKDPFADSAWTLAGSVEQGERDTTGDDAAFSRPELTDAQKALIEAARKKVAADKAAAGAVAAEQAARDATDGVTRPAPKPPTPEELARLAAKDKFRLLGKDTDPETAAKLAKEEARAADAGTGQALRSMVADSSETLDVSNAVIGEPEGLHPAAERVHHNRGTAYIGGAAVEERFAEDQAEIAYGVVIRTANARLVQALASFGDAHAMMTSYQGLNSANDPQGAWLTVEAMPSIERMASLR